MPVTARLSRAFYDRLGDAIANELVEWFNQVDLAYRSELRELNELNFARFDAKVGERLAELRTEFHAGLGQVRMDVAALKAEIERVRISGIRWTIGFWVPMIVTMVAVLLKK